MKAGKRIALVASPMLPSEEAYAWAKLARTLDDKAVLGLGPVPRHGEDRTYPAGAPDNHPKAFKVYAEKAPNARGVRRALSAFGEALDFDGMLRRLGKGSGSSDVGVLILMGNYPSRWATPDLMAALGGKFVVLVDTLLNDLTDKADVVLPGATWVEKAGTFENARGMVQAFEQAIPVIELAKSEGQLAADLMSVVEGRPEAAEVAAPVVVESTRGQVAAGARIALPRAEAFDPSKVRAEMAARGGDLAVFGNGVQYPAPEPARKPDMPMVDL